MLPLRAPLAIASLIAVAMLMTPARTSDAPAHLAVEPPATRETDSPSIKTMRLRSRETMEMALRRGGVSADDARNISAALRRVIDLRRLNPGERITLERGPQGALERVVHQRSVFERYELRPAPPSDADPDPAERTWSVHAHRATMETRVDAVSGRLEDSLFASVERLGEAPVLTAKFVALFEWDFDFAADALPGDEFRMVVEKRFGDGKPAGYGNILAAEYKSADRPLLSAVRFPDRDGSPRYYDYQGQATRKMFLRGPLEFTRITSGYSHARRHPILGGLRPHLAIDYGAPTGTPVRAVADGVVIASGHAGGYGLSVTLRHARGYETMYNHLSRIRVRAGQRVRQRDIIGHVGATGLATGPHLDYRVRKNGRWVDPLREKFIPGDPVPRERLRAFRMHVQSLRARLGSAPLATGPGDPLFR